MGGNRAGIHTKEISTIAKNAGGTRLGWSIIEGSKLICETQSEVEEAKDGVFIRVGIRGRGKQGRIRLVLCWSQVERLCSLYRREITKPRR